MAFTDATTLVTAIKSLDRSIQSIKGGSQATATNGPTRDHLLRFLETDNSTVSGKDEDGQKTPAEKRIVHVRVVFLKVGEIDTINQRYTADVYVHGRWLEPALDNKPQANSNLLEWNTKYWTPKLFVTNKLGDTKEECWHTVTHDKNGRATAYEKRRIKGAFWEYLELNQFPFDAQDLTVTVSTDVGHHEVELVEDLQETSAVNRESFVGEQEWQLHSFMHIWKPETSNDVNSSQNRYPSMSVAIRASRRPGFFIWNVLFVMLLLGTLCFSIFAVEITLVANRLQLSFILLLTTVSFKFVVTQSLPKIAYLTYLDKYILYCMAFLMGLAVWHAVLYHIHVVYPNANTSKWDNIAFCVLLGVWVSFQICFAIFVAIKNRRNKSPPEKGNSNDTSSDSSSKYKERSVSNTSYQLTANKVYPNEHDSGKRRIIGPLADYTLPSRLRQQGWRKIGETYYKVGSPGSTGSQVAKF